MTNDISKHYSVKLETKSTAKLNNNYLNFNYGDDITLSISIMDDGNPKNIDNCEVDMIIVNESRINPIIHNFSDGGITVANNVVTIVCKSGYIDMIGVNIAQLIIRNADQNISTQMFVYNTVSTLSSNDVESAIDGINTIHDIYELIDRMNSVLESVGSSTNELEGKVNDADTLVRTLVDKANTEIAGVNSIIEQAKASEDERKAAELLRIQNEDTRVSSENLRVASETTREQNELTRNTSETSRIEAELVRTNSENKRVTTENLRVEAEIKRSENEAGRVSAEQARVLEFETIKGEQESFKESVNEQILNSKTDYFGEEHLTVDKRLNEDFDKIWQFNNESQLLEYSGTNITANNSYYGLVKDLSIKGRTLQNLINDGFKNWSAKASGSNTITKENYKVIVNKPENTTQVSISLSKRYVPLLKPNTKYTVVAIISNNTLDIAFNLVHCYQNIMLTKNACTVNVGFNGIYIGSFTTIDDLSLGDVLEINIGANRTGTVTIENYMILEGDYTNAPLSELPYFKGIKSVGENEVTEDGKYKVRVKSCGKNLLNPLKSLNYDCGLRDIVGLDIRDIKGTSTTARVLQYFSIKPKTYYTMSVENYDGIFQTFIGTANASYIGITNEVIWIETDKVTIFTGENAHYIFINMHSGYNVQIEEGTVATDYEPYKETVVEYLLDEPLRSLPNGACDVLDVENGTVTRKIFKLVLDGSLKLGARGGYTNGDYTEWYIGPDVLPNPGVNYNSSISRGNSICDKLPTPKKGESLSNYGEWCFVNGLGGLSVRLLNTKLSTTEDTSGVRQWLSENPVTLYYVLKTPIVEQLKEHHPFSYEGTTHIFSDNLLPPTISCSIPSNVPAVISSLRLENEILNNEVATLSLENEQLKENNDTQDEVINVSLLATDEMYNMLEPILSMTAEISMLEVGEVSKMVDLYVAMIQRGLKTIDQVPERYRKQVQDILDKLDE